MFCVPSISGLFKWRQFEPEVILLAVGWYLRFSLSYREVEELLAEPGLWVDHVTVWRWVQRYAPEVDSTGATLDFLLSAKQTRPQQSASWPKPWANRTIPRRVSSTPMGMRLTRPRSLSSRMKELWTPAASTGRCHI